MNPEQPTPTNYSDEKVEGGKLAAAQFPGNEKDDTVITYWGNDGVFERACYLSPHGKPEFHLIHTEAGSYDSKGVRFNCYNEGKLPPRLRENMSAIQGILERFLK